MKANIISLAQAKALIGRRASNAHRPGIFTEKFGIPAIGKVGRVVLFDRNAVMKWLSENPEPMQETAEVALESVKSIHRRLDLLTSNTKDLTAVVASLTTLVKTLNESFTSHHTESGVGYSLITDELNKIKMQLVEMSK